MRLSSLVFVLLCTPLLLLAQKRSYTLHPDANPNLVQKDRIVVKLKPGFRSSISSIVSPVTVRNAPIQPVRKVTKNQRGKSILDGIYYVDLKEGQEPIEAINELLKNDEVDYAEVLVYEQLFHTPNDPFADQTSGNQDYLQTIKAYEAWDITKGNPNILIGIVDTGMDIDHADLINKYFQNTNEVVDGVDNDGNGYVDDVLGYDFADNDNNPNADTDVNSTLNHGTHVGGISGAQTNNNLGIASIGYDCSIVPLKGFTTSGLLSTGVWEGVIYAADNGYDIVNLSWGNTNGYNQYYQDIINYCVLEKDMVVIAAAGNTNAEIDFYPASYDHVISVAASTLSDTKWSSGSYSDHVDIMAPGASIYSTQKDDTYGSDSGSSHASPMVAGVAGLVKSIFPSYNARQVMEHLRVTTDDVYGVSGNEAYPFKLGKGRLNAYRAVTETDTKSIRVHNLEFNNGYGKYAFYGDTVTLTFDLTNYLKKVESPIISLESDSPYITIFQDQFEPGLMQPMQTVNGSSFQVVLDESTPANTEINLRFFMEDGTYSDFQNVSFFTSPDYLNAESIDLSLTFGGNGDVGLTESYTAGSSLKFQEANIGSYHGLLFGDSETSLFDNVPSFFYPAANDGDFLVTKTIKHYLHSAVGPIGYSEFRTWNSDFVIEQTIIPGQSEGFITVEYRIVNISDSDISDFRIGFFSDQEITGGANTCTWSPSDEALVFTDESGSLVGALASTITNPGYVALNMQDFNGHTQDIDNSFTNGDKFGFLSGNDVSLAGELSGGNDVAGILKTAIPNFSNNSEYRVAFIISAAETAGTLSSNLAAARSTYETFLSNPETSEVFFSCEGGEVIVKPEGTEFDFFEDALGNDLIASGTSLLVDNIVKDTAIYVQNKDAGYPTRLTKVSIEILEDIALFEPSIDTLYLDHATLNTITFQDLSYQPSSWSWDFSNGEQANTQNPTVNFQTVGTYSITLTVESDLGCTDEYARDVVVANRPAPPSLDDYSICVGETIELTHPTDEYAVFNDAGIRILKGSIIYLGPFEEDSSLLIANKINGFESLPVEVVVTVDPIDASYEIYPDTISTATGALIRFNGSNASSFDWKVNGSSISDQSEFTTPVTGNFDLELTVDNGNCTDFTSETISLTASPTPSQSDLQVCVGDRVTISPKNGTYFGFYQDQDLTQLLRKGTQLSLDDITANTSVYITGLDNILPSSPIMVSISPVDLSGSFEASPPSLDLTQGSTVEFTTDQITSARWYVDGNLIETSLNPILFFDQAGTYAIRLDATTNAGCDFTETISYLVTDLVTGSEPDNQLIIFPNPSSGEIFIQSVAPIQHISVLDLTGKVIRSSLDVSKNYFDLNLGSGVYLLKIVTPVSTNLKKISIR